MLRPTVEFCAEFVGALDDVGQLFVASCKSGFEHGGFRAVPRERHAFNFTQKSSQIVLTAHHLVVRDLCFPLEGRSGLRDKHRTTDGYIEPAFTALLPVHRFEFSTNLGNARNILVRLGGKPHHKIKFYTIVTRLERDCDFFDFFFADVLVYDVA